MSYEREMTLLVPPEDLLSAIWYSDGSGCRSGVGSTTCPDEWEVTMIWLDKDNNVVTVKLKRISP